MLFKVYITNSPLVLTHPHLTSPLLRMRRSMRRSAVFPVPSNNPRSLCESWLGPGYSSFLSGEFRIKYRNQNLPKHSSLGGRLIFYLSWFCRGVRSGAWAACLRGVQTRPVLISVHYTSLLKTQRTIRKQTCRVFNKSQWPAKFTAYLFWKLLWFKKSIHVLSLIKKAKI